MMMRLVAVVALFSAAAIMATAPPASAADKPPPPQPPPAERRITSNRDTLNGRGESGVSGTGVGAVTDTPGSSQSAVAATTSQCHWAVAWRPQGSILETTGALTLRPLSGDLPSDASFATAFRLQLDSAGYDLVQSGADSQGLRYVLPYGTPACAAATGAFVTVSQVENLARQAFDEVKHRWPTQTITLGWAQPTEDTWTALATPMLWQPISAAADNGGLTVTVTASPRGALWDIGRVNTRVGGAGMVRCAGPGDLPRLQAQASCRVWFAGPSTGLTDRHGQADAISLGLTVEWNVAYTSNIPGFADPSWLTWPTESFLDGVVVNTTQAVPAARAG